jgi:hypothetical protein
MSLGFLLSIAADPIHRRRCAMLSPGVAYVKRAKLAAALQLYAGGYVVEKGLS